VRKEKSGEITRLFFRAELNGLNGRNTSITSFIRLFGREKEKLNGKSEHFSVSSGKGIFGREMRILSYLRIQKGKKKKKPEGQIYPTLTV